MTIDRASLSDQIRSVLIQRIVIGELEPGTRLVEMSLAREFETSQTPVREALHALEAMRLVEPLPRRGGHAGTGRRGVRVRNVSDSELAEGYAVRGVLEEFAAGLAVGRLLRPDAGEGVTQLAMLAELTRVDAERGEHAAYAVHDSAFHRLIVAASGNTTLLRLWDSLSFEYRTPLMLIRHSHNLRKIAAEHVDIVEAFKERDGALAGRLLRTHSDSIGAAGKRSAEQLVAANDGSP